MRLEDGTTLRLVRFRDPHAVFEAGKDGCRSLTISLEANGTWVVIEADWATFMRPLIGNLSVVLADDPYKMKDD